MNEVVKNENEVVEVLDVKKEDLTLYNISKGDDIIGLDIKVRNVKASKGNTFKSVKGRLYLPCYDANGFNGYKTRWLDVHFTKDVFKDAFEGSLVKSIEDLSSGTLFLRKKGIQIPSKYEVTKDKDGKDVYPLIWIKNSIIGFRQYSVDDEVFEYHKPVKDAEVVESIEEETEEDFKGVE